MIVKWGESYYSLQSEKRESRRSIASEPIQSVFTVSRSFWLRYAHPTLRMK